MKLSSESKTFKENSSKTKFKYFSQSRLASSSNVAKIPEAFSAYLPNKMMIMMNYVNLSRSLNLQLQPPRFHHN